jgi:hypothetical protein
LPDPVHVHLVTISHPRWQLDARLFPHVSYGTARGAASRMQSPTRSIELIA